MFCYVMLSISNIVCINLTLPSHVSKAFLNKLFKSNGLKFCLFKNYVQRPRRPLRVRPEGAEAPD
jgi:hypothetical protein